MAREQLTDLVRGIAYAVGSAQAVSAEHLLLQLRQFFDKDTDGKTLIPKLVRIQHPTVPDQFMLVPLFSLISPSSLRMEEVKIDLSLTIAEVKQRYATNEGDNSRATRSSYSIEVGPKLSRENGRPTEVVDVSITFKANDPPEGISRIIEDLAASIESKKHFGKDWKNITTLSGMPKSETDKSKPGVKPKPVDPPPVDPEPPMVVDAPTPDAG